MQKVLAKLFRCASIESGAQSSRPGHNRPRFGITSSKSIVLTLLAIGCGGRTEIDHETASYGGLPTSNDTTAAGGTSGTGVSSGPAGGVSSTRVTGAQSGPAGGVPIGTGGVRATGGWNWSGGKPATAGMPATNTGGSRAGGGVSSTVPRASSGFSSTGGRSITLASTIGGSGATGSTTSGGSLATGGTTTFCGSMPVVLASLPPVIEFLVDGSDNMEQGSSDADASADAHRVTLAGTLNALEEAFELLPSDWLGDVRVFNGPDPNTCLTTRSFGIGPFAQSWYERTHWYPFAEGSGAAPTYSAWDQARAALILDWPTEAPPLYGNRYVVLVTAGSPNVNRDGCTWGSANPDTCRDGCISEEEYDFFVSQVERLGIPTGVRTFVVGLPGSENPRGASFDPLFMLSRFAAAGGGAEAGCVADEGVVARCDASTCLAQRGNYCHLDLSASNDIWNDLTSAVASKLPARMKACGFALPEPLLDASNYRASLYLDYLETPNEIADRQYEASSPDCADGSYYLNDNQNPTAVVFCPALCDRLSQNPESRVSAWMVCHSVG